MSTQKPRHNLSNVDLENRTATCAVCGETEIYVYRNVKLSKTEVHYLNKIRENNKAVQQRVTERRRSKNQNWKPRRQITEVDVEMMVGLCSVCGPAKVYKRTFQNGTYTVYLCANKRTAEWRSKHRGNMTTS